MSEACNVDRQRATALAEWRSRKKSRAIGLSLAGRGRGRRLRGDSAAARRQKRSRAERVRGCPERVTRWVRNTGYRPGEANEREEQSWLT